MPNVHVISANELIYQGKRYRCAVGPNGFTDTPKEGDKATPIGTFSLRECWYRADRIDKPKTLLPLHVIHPDDGWCDAPEDPNYNAHVKLPFAASHETLWRTDHIYDIIVPIGFNDREVVPGKGSAIFFHIARPNYEPTLGCIGIAHEDMLEILHGLSADSLIEIEPKS